MSEQNKKQEEETNKDQQRTGADDATPIYLTGNSTLQTPEEDRHDKSIDPRDEDVMEPSNDDIHITNADRLAGSDRAGTAERKSNDL
jgi:hypothetical protein